MNTNTTKDTRLVARVSLDVQELIQSAAEISGATVSQFLVDSAMSKARTVINDAMTIKLSIQGSKDLFALLDNPPPPNNKLKSLAERYNNGYIYDKSTNNGTDQTA